MIDFSRSFFTWKSHPIQPDPYYKYAGGFVGRYGAVHHVRIQFDATCTLINEEAGRQDELFLLCPCRSEYTIVTENLFQVPNTEFRVVMGRAHHVPIARRPANQPEDSQRQELGERFADYALRLHTIEGARTLTTTEEVIEATQADHVLNARTTYRDCKRGVKVVIEFPVKLINLQPQESLFQVCTGAVALPDLTTWDGVSVDRMFLAHVAFSGFDYVEFALRREIEAHERERLWLEEPRGRDRLELRSPDRRPPGYPPPRPWPTGYHEIVRQDASTVLLSAACG